MAKTRIGVTGVSFGDDGTIHVFRDSEEKRQARLRYALDDHAPSEWMPTGGAEQPNPEPPMDIPKTKVLHCTHCDRHHEAELQGMSAAAGALYLVECPATGRVVKQWVKPGEMWG